MIKRLIYKVKAQPFVYHRRVDIITAYGRNYITKDKRDELLKELEQRTRSNKLI